MDGYQRCATLSTIAASQVTLEINQGLHTPSPIKSQPKDPTFLSSTQHDIGYEYRRLHEILNRILNKLIKGAKREKNSHGCTINWGEGAS